MTRALPRTNFNRSRLIRLLADLALVDAVEAKPDFAERLGSWLDFADAITLQTALGAAGAAPAAGVVAGVDAPRLDALQAQFAATRTALADSISASCSGAGGDARIKLPAPRAGATTELAAAYEPYRRFYLAHQGGLEAGVRVLRSQVRQALAQAGPTLRQLAQLDAAFEHTLGGRERQLLATLPALLERRYAQLLAAHQRRLAASGQADDPAAWSRRGAWLADFCQDLETVLLAELDLRLQPTVGMMEALSNEAA